MIKKRSLFASLSLASLTFRLSIFCVVWHLNKRTGYLENYVKKKEFFRYKPGMALGVPEG
jgi:hypothetical protein